MSILSEALKAFSQQLDDDKNYYKNSEYNKQSRREFNMIDICNEIESNYNKMKQKKK